LLAGSARRRPDIENARSEILTAGTVKKAAAIVMGGMIVSRILGYVRYKAIFYFFGRGFETDAFFGAFAVPDLLYILASGGAMTAAFIPAFSELLEKDKKEDAWRLASGIANIAFLLIGVMVGLGIVFAPELLRVIVPGFAEHPETFDLAVVIMRIIFPMVVLTSLSALCNGVLHSHNHFVAPTVAWSMHNIGIITAVLLFHDVLGIRGVAYGVVAGAGAMVAVQLPVMAKKGMKYYFSFGLGNPAVKRVLKLFLPAMLGLAISQINLMIMPITFGSLMGEGAVSALQGAVRLLLLPLGIFGNAISMAIFPTLSRHAGAGRMGEFRSTLVRGVSSTFVFSLPSMVIFFFLGFPMTRFLFGGGEFTVADCSATALALFYYAIGLPGHTAIQVVSRGYYSMKDTRTPLLTGLASVLIITVPFCFGLAEPGLPAATAGGLLLLKAACWISPFYHMGAAMQDLGYAGVALSVSMATIFNCLVLLVLLKRRVPDLEMRRIWLSLFRVGAAAGAMAVACWVAVALTAGLDPFVVLAAGGAAGFGVFLAAGRLMKIEEMDEVAGMLKARFRKSG